jgi:hypothetical protein
MKQFSLVGWTRSLPYFNVKFLQKGCATKPHNTRDKKDLFLNVFSSKNCPWKKFSPARAECLKKSWSFLGRFCGFMWTHHASALSILLIFDCACGCSAVIFQSGALPFLSLSPLPLSLSLSVFSVSIPVHKSPLLQPRYFFVWCLKRYEN